MIRVLLMTARLPYPLNDGWKIRTYHLIKGWKESGARVDLLSFTNSEDEDKDVSMDNLRALCENIYTVTREKSYNWKNLLKGLISSTPFTVHNYWKPQMLKMATDITNKIIYDIVQIEDVVMAQYLPECSESIRILDMHNVESYLLERYASNELNLFKKIYAFLTARKLRVYEGTVSSLFDRVLVCSGEDKNLLCGYGVRTSIEVLPNGVNCSHFYSVPLLSDSTDDIVFVGSMDYHANISGVLYFVKNILPLIKEKIPGVRLLIVGKNPAEAIRSLADDQIVVTGTVPDIQPYLAKARVMVVPLLVGGGTRLKILEAMAAGKPIVSTTIGAEGIQAKHREHIILADDPGAFASNVLELFNNTDDCRAMGEAARELVKSTYDWHTLTTQFINSMSDLLRENKKT